MKKQPSQSLSLSPVCVLPAGFRAAGISAGLKASGAPDMAMVFSDRPATVVATFTTNQVKAATVRLDSARVKAYGIAHGIVVNSGQANACTGKAGDRDAADMAAHAARRMGVAPELFLVCSTGRIGVRLDMAKIRPGIDALAAALSPDGGEDAARGILTTDTHPKRFTAEFTANGRRCRLTGFAKGSGMIQPNMATMLAFFLTDAAVHRPSAQALFRRAVDDSFNRVSVDGDRSTNDSAFLLANGAAGNEPLRPSHPDWPAFAEALRAISLALAKEMARDGEGASKFVTLTVRGAASSADADAAVRAVGNSFLVKTSWVGTYPNWGRVMDALGYSPARVNESRVDIFYDGLPAVLGGVRGPAPEADLSAILAKPEFSIDIDLHLGRASAVLYTCDCTEEYVRINMD
ncbi:MAG: bifunctional glutamate N-acetyltransferase/amino-acid acetyltransferase ArgJ [Kiritimatiellae bacterium]|nr:bifunctional glutamate N-acetyltransferase/amino-acid acetyltransferase ArgJ [Kiritimatiellia bacterium]